MSDIEQIKAVLEQLRPYIKMDGGDMTFESLSDDGVVTLRLHGACVGCDYLDNTLKGAVEALLMERVAVVRGCISIE